MAVAILTAAFPVQGRSDECTEYRTAIAIEEAASAAYWSSPDPDLDDSPENAVRRRVLETLSEALSEAREARQDAERAVRDSIEHEAATDAIDTLAAIGKAHDAAHQAMRDWLSPFLSNRGYPIHRLIVDAEHAAADALREALFLACELGLVRVKE